MNRWLWTGDYDDEDDDDDNDDNDDDDTKIPCSLHYFHLWWSCDHRMNSFSQCHDSKPIDEVIVKDT